MVMKTSNNNDAQECCCCQVDEYNEMNRSWTKTNNCTSPYQCCNIPSKEECEVQLNPTFDGSCGHMHESKYQKQNNGPSSQIIPRSGSNYQMKGWLGQRLYDVNLNVIEEWCIDNGYKDSFFLWRFVHCNGDYPNWFGRCVFPSATNSLIYKGCNENNFHHTIPTCFGELEEMNIGLGQDIGHDVDYRYNVNDETLFVWCTNYTTPKDPLYNIQYEGKAPGKDDGIVPFYLSQCRDTYTVINNDNDNDNNNNNNNNNRLIRDYHVVNKNNNYNINKYKHEMKPLTFRVGVSLVRLGDNLYEVIITGNNMPLGYESVIQYNDSLSINILNAKNLTVSAVYINSINSQNWSYNITIKQYITFTYIGEKQIILHNNNNITLFIIKLNNLNINTTQNIHVGWIARSSNNKNGTFVGFGKMLLQ